MDREFNLIDEPWICVRMTDCKTKEVGLRDALLQSHTYTELAGETKTQDFAVLRLMLAVICTVFSRYDTEGSDLELGSDPVDYWKAVWDSGTFPEAPFARYFSEWKDRFWLFDSDYPFCQSKAAKEKGNPISTAKMIGTLFESNNKARLFSDRNQAGRALSYAEAARWLLHLNCFDDIAAKNPTPKRTWCGKLSLVALTGRNLFETLMLNYCANADSVRALPKMPAWEIHEPSSEFNRQIVPPNEQAALLTLQSRKIWLCREGDAVNAYRLAGGDWFEEDAHFDEQMTLWNGYREKPDAPTQFKPKRYDTSKLIWQEFGSISALAVEQRDARNFTRPAGVVEWMHFLVKKKLLRRDYHVKICTAAVIYDFKQATSLPVLDTVSDTISFHSNLLDDAGAAWRRMIVNEVGKCEKAAGYVYLLYKNLQLASGRRDKDEKESQSGEQDAKREYYARIDREFRLWLDRLDPDSDLEEAVGALEAVLRRIAIYYGRELAAQCGGQTVFGRNSDNEIVSSAEALNIFEGSVKKLFSDTDSAENGGESN